MRLDEDERLLLALRPLTRGAGDGLALGEAVVVVEVLEEVEERALLALERHLAQSGVGSGEWGVGSGEWAVGSSGKSELTSHSKYSTAIVSTAIVSTVQP